MLVCTVYNRQLLKEVICPLKNEQVELESAAKEIAEMLDIYLASVCTTKKRAYIRHQLHGKAGRTQTGKESTHQLKPMFQATVFPIYKYLDKLHSMGEHTQLSLWETFRVKQ